MDLRIFRPVRALPAMARSLTGREVSLRLAEPTDSVYGALVGDKSVEITAFDLKTEVKILLPPNARAEDYELLRYAVLVDLQGNPNSPVPLSQSFGFGASAQLASGIDIALQRAQRILLRDVGGDPLLPQSGAGMGRDVAGRVLTSAQAAALISLACDRFNAQASSRQSSGLHVSRISLQSVLVESMSNVKTRYGIVVPGADGTQRVIIAVLQWVMSDSSSVQSTILV